MYWQSKLTVTGSSYLTMAADTGYSIARIDRLDQVIAMGLRELLDSKAVLTHEEVTEALGAKVPRRQRTKDSLVRYYQRAGRLLRARRGLYVVVPPGTGTNPETCPVDAHLLAAKAAPDAVLAYHTALELHGRAYTTFDRLYYLSSHQQRTWSFRQYVFQRVAFPVSLTSQGREAYGVQMVDHAGEQVRVTSLERTLVDVLHRPDLAGGHEEAWRSLESVEFFDLDRVVEYALFLNNATVVAKVGFFLEQHREPLMVDDAHLNVLRPHAPKQPHYLDRHTRGKTAFVRNWNLVVPREVMERSWQEVR